MQRYVNPIITKPRPQNIKTVKYLLFISILYNLLNYVNDFKYIFTNAIYFKYIFSDE
jgi:hypothetical protein